jgi:hypothetical protein
VNFAALIGGGELPLFDQGLFIVLNLEINLDELAWGWGHGSQLASPPLDRHGVATSAIVAPGH